jgi:hypothetical protein
MCHGHASTTPRRRASVRSFRTSTFCRTARARHSEIDGCQVRRSVVHLQYLGHRRAVVKRVSDLRAHAGQIVMRIRCEINAPIGATVSPRSTWPDLSRPSTSSLCAGSEDVDGGPSSAMTMRHKLRPVNDLVGSRQIPSANVDRDIDQLRGSLLCPYPASERSVDAPDGGPLQWQSRQRRSTSATDNDLTNFVPSDFPRDGLSPRPTACFNAVAEFDVDLLTALQATRGQKRITMLLIIMKNR